MPAGTTFSTSFNAELLNGIEVINARVPAIVIDDNGESLHTEKQQFMAIPYYAWANRGRGEMMIWFPEKIKDIDLVSNE